METLLQYGLLAVFLALPPPISSMLPEEVTLMTAGYLAGAGHRPLWASLLVAYLGIVSADTLTWAIGRRLGLHPEGWAARLVGAHRVERIERFYRRYGPWAIVLCRQLPGMRTPAFFFAGASGFPLTRFLAYEMSAALLTVGVYVTLGDVFADSFDEVLARVERARAVLLALVGAGVAVGLIWALVRRLRR